MQASGWFVTTAIALYCVRNDNIVQHRRWMIRSYFFAMVFTVARLIIPIPPVLNLGDTGIEIVVWSTIAAAFLPGILLDWRAIVLRPATKQTMAMALEHIRDASSSPSSSLLVVPGVDIPNEGTTLRRWSRRVKPL